MPLSGILPVIVTVGVWPRIEHPLKASEVMVPRPAPGRPEPCLSVPFATEDVQVTDWPAVLSVITVFPAVPVVAPPGLTVHVAAVANAGAAAMPMTAAVAALVMSALPKRLRIALTPFPVPVMLAARRSPGYALCTAHRWALPSRYAHSRHKVTRALPRENTPE